MSTKMQRGCRSLTWLLTLLLTAMVGCNSQVSQHASVPANPIGVQRDKEAEKLLAVAGLNAFCFRFHGRAIDFWPEIPGNPAYSTNLRDTFNHGASMSKHMQVNTAQSSLMEANWDGTFILIQDDEFSWTFRYHLHGETAGTENASGSTTWDGATTWGGAVNFDSQHDLIAGATSHRFVVSDTGQVLQKDSDTLILGTIEFVGSDANVVGEIPIRYAFHQDAKVADKP
jgi:hypothetical protein